MSRAVLAAVVAVFALFVLASASLFTVQQTEQVLITQFGQPIRVINTPGLHVRVPFVQQVISFDRRLLDYETPGEEIILNDQRRLIAENETFRFDARRHDNGTKNWLGHAIVPDGQREGEQALDVLAMARGGR